ncbi:agamous-like MADS-box protein AGL61 [Impatiens glandulifera]|uniref:agamous-like MADS-box protein AGL61 n=1 Tax=Impatiens glandulifera TaxID=253017 RepID=UPI001FB12F8E|nr:agamous-like MADS-box protein AGL61 [Impatiens glandulifera]
MAKIEKKNHLQVTFSKRRTGLFKKASELSTLCGVEIAIVVFSPAEKAFSFGHPNVDFIANRYLAEKTGDHHRYFATPTLENNVDGAILEMNRLLEHISNELEGQKKKMEIIEQVRKSREKNDYWWGAPIEEMNRLELEKLKESMEELKKNVMGSPLWNNYINHVYGGGLGSSRGFC